MTLPSNCFDSSCESGTYRESFSRSRYDTDGRGPLPPPWPRRAAELAAPLLALAERCETLAALRQHLEPERTRGRDRLDQPHQHDVAQPVAEIAAAADE